MAPSNQRMQQPLDGTPIRSHVPLPGPIANRALDSSKMPPPGADWDAIQRFALTFDGYTAFGDECGNLANARQEGRLPIERHTLSVLRGCLFFEQRRWRHFGEEPEGNNLRYMQALLEAIRSRVQQAEELLA